MRQSKICPTASHGINVYTRQVQLEAEEEEENAAQADKRASQNVESITLMPPGTLSSSAEQSPNDETLSATYTVNEAIDHMGEHRCHMLARLACGALRRWLST